MSSIENMVMEIEDDYYQIMREFEKHLSPPNFLHSKRYDQGFKIIFEKDLLVLLRKSMSFQRKIEYTVDNAKKLGKTLNLKRLNEITNNLMDRLCNPEIEFETIEFYSYGEYQVVGVIPSLKLAHKKLLILNKENESKILGFLAYHGFKLTYPILIEMEEELRLIGALTTYPIEKRAILKNQLVINDFEQVAVSLEEAESNTEANHFKDTVSRCRDAVEIFIATIREKETGEKTEKHFSTDLGKICKIGIYDEATKKLAQGVYSFLSLKGSHKYDAKKITIYDAETSMKETYSLIEILLKKLSDFKKKRAK